MSALDSSLVFSVIQTSILVLGALYTYNEYRLFRRHAPKIEFTVDFVLYAIAGRSGHYLVDIEMVIKNIGQVRMYLPEITVGVKTLAPEDVDSALRTHGRVKFSRELIPKHNIVHRPEDPYWVDPGVAQVFPYPVVISDTKDFVQVNSEFRYYRRKEKIAYHQASIVKPVPT
jgi:hypothetical protein